MNIYVIEELSDFDTASESQNEVLEPPSKLNVSMIDPTCARLVK